MSQAILPSTAGLSPFHGYLVRNYAWQKTMTITGTTQATYLTKSESTMDARGKQVSSSFHGVGRSPAKSICSNTPHGDKIASHMIPRVDDNRADDNRADDKPVGTIGRFLVTCLLIHGPSLLCDRCHTWSPAAQPNWPPTRPLGKTVNSTDARRIVQGCGAMSGVIVRESGGRRVVPRARCAALQIESPHRRPPPHEPSRNDWQPLEFCSPPAEPG